MTDPAAGAGWTAVAAEADLREGRPVRVPLPDADLLLVRTPSAVYAVSNRCTHQAARLDQGRVDPRPSLPTVTCAVHGSVFSLRDGRVLRGPAMSRLPVYEARVEEGMVEVRESPAP